MARRTVRARRAKPAQGLLAAAGLQPGRGALITMAILCVLGLGLVIWYQTPTSGAIAAKESEWKIVISADRHIAGDVTFDLANRGTIPHEFLVVATDKTAEELLADVDATTNRIDEENLDVVDEQPEYGPGTTAELTLTLPVGHYVVMCNIEGHYRNGMYADLNITERPDGVVVERTPPPDPVSAIGAITGTETEWAIEISTDLHEAGLTTFNLTNAGSMPHEFLVVRSEKTAEELLADVDAATSRIDEELLDVLDEQPEYSPGTPGQVTVDLTPGHYVVMCNIAGHYQQGMYADLEITEPVAATGNIAGTEAEWKIELDSYTHVAGEMTFNLTNGGTMQHEFLVVRSKKTAAQLLGDVDDATARIDEEMLNVIDEQPEYAPGVPGLLTITLKPGHYVVMCNIAGHYQQGMYADFTVVK